MSPDRPGISLGSENKQHKKFAIVFPWGCYLKGVIKITILGKYIALLIA